MFLKKVLMDSIAGTIISQELLSKQMRVSLTFSDRRSMCLASGSGCPKDSFAS